MWYKIPTFVSTYALATCVEDLIDISYDKNGESGRIMAFTSFEFFGIFLVLVWCIHQLLRNTMAKNIVMLVASIYFYFNFANSVSIGFQYLGLLLLSILITYVGGILGYKHKQKTGRATGYWIAFVCNLSILFICKYTVFTVETINAFVNRYGTVIPLPI